MGERHIHYAPVLFIALISTSIIAGTSTQHRQQPHISIASCLKQEASAIWHRPPRAFRLDSIQNTEISADSSRSGADGSITLKGNVIIERDLLRIASDHASFNKQKNTLQLTGNVQIDSANMTLHATSGNINLDADKHPQNTLGQFHNIKFLIADSTMKGKAQRIELQDTKPSEQANRNQRSTLYNSSITSCLLSDPDWLISASEIRLNHIDEYGSADDVVVRFKGVPFLYTPYLAFPISDKRRTGLLFPEFAASSSRGIEITLPWYWNIAPNHDLVLTPHNMVRRGLELGAQYRYLTRLSHGDLSGTYLHDDDITGENRYHLRYQHQTRFLPNLLFDVDFQTLSDAEYFNDFSNDTGSTSQTHISRNASLTYNLTNWRMRALVQDIETIDSSSAISARPYVRLPQLTIDGETNIASSALLFTLDSEFVDFSHEDDKKTAGSRLTLGPGFRLPLSGSAWFIEPAIKFSHTQYSVGSKDNASQASTSQNIKNRNLPVSSIDAGLFFERYFANGYQHTLEPRLYFLNIPFADQSNTPLFDTSTPEFSVAQLFRDNRFIGGDRIGDTRQLTLSLTSRIINPNTGDEFLRASIGQIFYFKDRQVSLDNTIDTSRQSDIIADLETNWGHWKSNIELQWDTENNELSRENYFLHYRSDDRHLFNLGYRKRLKNGDIDLEQTDVSFVYAINHQYSVIARWNYSLKDKKSIDAIAGIAYNSCCWALQLLAQRRLTNTSSTIDNDGDDYDTSILVQFVFKGLGSLSGSTTRTTLEQSIYSYTDIFQ